MKNTFRSCLLGTVLLSSTSTIFAEVDFAKQIQPVLANKCYKCHSAPHEEDGKMKKPKGGLEMDSLAALIKGGEDGKVIEPGQPDKSPLYVATTLPKDDDKFMPPKGDPLTDAEKTLLKQWITEGAKFGDWKAATPANVAKGDKPASGHTSGELPDPYAPLIKGVQPANADAIKRIEAAGGRALPLAQNHPLLRVDFLMNRTHTNDQALAALEGAKDQITQLELGETKITDGSLSQIAKLSRLTRLDLHKTEITDAGVQQLSGLQNLWYLNLYGTKVTDAGLKAIAGMKNLQNVYLWQSQVTDAGVAELQKQLPKLHIVWK